MTERNILRLAEKSESYGLKYDKPITRTETWKMNEHNPLAIGALHNSVEAKTIEGHPMHGEMVKWEIKWKSQNVFGHQTTREGNANMSGVVDTKALALDTIHHWAKALSRTEIYMVRPGKEGEDE